MNILTNVLKVELEKQGKKVYPVTYALKGVDYCAYTQDKNVIIFPCLTMPGKKSATEALMMSPFPRHNMRVVSAYQFTYIQLQTEFTMGLVGLYLRKKYNIPMVYTSHTMWNDMMEKRYSKFVAKIINFVINHFMLVPPLKYSDLMTVPTHKVKDYYMNKWHKGEPIVVLPGCVDGNNFAMNDEDYEKLEKLRETFQLKDKIVLGYIGRVSKEKSIDVVLDYFEKCAEENHNLVLMIVGDGPYFKQINERCRYSKFNERIFFTGGVPNNTLKYYYRLFNVFCTASTFETQGLTYIESMWCHVPILAKDDRCLDHFLISGVNGVTFSDYDSWRVGLYKLTTDEIFTKHIVDEGYKTAKTYAKDIYAKRMYFLYNQARKFINKEIDEVDYDAFNAIK